MFVFSASRMRIFTAIIALGMALPASAQQAEEEEIVVVGIADGSKVVEVDFDKVWKRCVECKRALKKLDKLAENYRDELEVAGYFSSGGATGHCSGESPASVGSFQRSSAEPVDLRRRTPKRIVDGLCSARLADTSRRTYAAVTEKYAVPERARLLAHMQSFLDQLTPHVVAATEEERVARGAKASIIGKRNAKLSARKLVRVNVTEAVIKRLDAKPFTIVLPDPQPSTSAARK